MKGYFPDVSVCPGGGREAIPRHVRIRLKPRKIRDMGIRQLNKQQRNALKKYNELGATPEVKKEAAISVGYAESGAVRTMDNLLQCRSIVAALDKVGGTDELIAKKMVEGLESEHPLKPGRPDPHAIHKFVTEHNKVRGNYAPTKISTENKSEVMVVHLTAGNIKEFDKFVRMRGAHSA